MAMLIRRETPADYEGVHRIHSAAFAGNGAVTPPAEPGLVDELRADGDLVPALSLVAEVDGGIIGHVCCSHARILEAGTELVGLGPIGVFPDWQRAGVGSALMHAVIAAADALEAPAVVLLGSPHYYSRFGFVLAAEHGIAPPLPEWAPHFQVRTLAAWQGDERGTFQYAPAFQRL